jgi:hypothetical protein
MKVFRGPQNSSFSHENIFLSALVQRLVWIAAVRQKQKTASLKFYLCVCVTSRHGQSDRHERSCLVTEAVQWETGNSGVSSLANTRHRNRADMYVQQSHLLSETNWKKIINNKWEKGPKGSLLCKYEKQHYVTYRCMFNNAPSPRIVNWELANSQ